MQDDELKVLFRKNELEARKQRRAHLLRCLANEGKLLQEDMSPEDQVAHNEAVRQIARQEQIFYEEMERERYSYWRRLWRALTNAR